MRVLLALLAMSAVASADGSAQLSIATDADARITVDDQPAAPLTFVNAGRHVVVVTRRGRRPEARVVDLALFERRAIAIDLAETDQRRVVPWAIGGAGALGVGSLVAIAFAGSAASTASRIESEREATGITASQLVEYQRALSRHDRDVDLAIGTAIGGLVVGAAALGLYWFDDRAAIVVQPGGAMVVGTF